MACQERTAQELGKIPTSPKTQVDTAKRIYYGIAGNSEGIRQFFDGAMRIWYRWLNRRSQHRSYTWKGFKEMTKQYQIPRPKVVEEWWIKPSVQYSLDLA
ncbi:MAG: hypothetical protein ACM3YE_10150 [Bacteroidota bacterium]